MFSYFVSSVELMTLLPLGYIYLKKPQSLNISPAVDVKTTKLKARVSTFIAWPLYNVQINLIIII